MAFTKIQLNRQKFGRLTVIEEVDSYICVDSDTKERRWECLCTCGNYVLIRQRNLRSGKTKSCGCLHKQGGEKYNKDIGRKYK